MTPVIEVSRLTKTFGTFTAINQVDLTIERGEVMGFLGANGAGKSTTLRCIAGLLRPTSGHVTILGRNPATEQEVLKVLGYLPGELRLYDHLTGLEHLRLLADLQGAPCDRQQSLCDELQLNERDLHKPIRSYSRGMKQKIGIVQAFQHNPEVVLLDEPTEGLDPLIQQIFFDLIAAERAKGTSILLSSHIMSEVQQTCDRAAIIKSGELISVEAVSSLRNGHTRNVTVLFEPNFDHTNLVIGSASNEHWQDSRLTISVPASEIASVLRQLLQYPVVDVLVEEPGLESALLQLYGTRHD